MTKNWRGRDNNAVDLIEQLKKDNTIEQLQEVGKINIDYIDEDLEMLSDVLEKTSVLKQKYKV